MNEKVCGTPKETTLTESLTANCEKAKTARDMANRISSNLFPPTSSEPGNVPNVSCAMEKTFEESIVLEELLHTLQRIIDRL